MGAAGSVALPMAGQTVNGFREPQQKCALAARFWLTLTVLFLGLCLGGVLTVLSGGEGNHHLVNASLLFYGLGCAGFLWYHRPFTWGKGFDYWIVESFFRCDPDYYWNKPHKSAWP